MLRANLEYDRNGVTSGPLPAARGRSATGQKQTSANRCQQISHSITSSARASSAKAGAFAVL